MFISPGFNTMHPGERLSLDVSGGNTEFDQEAIGALETLFRERLILFHGTTPIRMAFKCQACIRLAWETDLEVTSEYRRVFSWLASRPTSGFSSVGLAVAK